MVLRYTIICIFLFKLITFFITDSAALKDKNDFRNLFRREYPVFEEKHEVYKGLKNLDPLTLTPKRDCS